MNTVTAEKLLNAKSASAKAKQARAVTKVQGGQRCISDDAVIREAPLEIYLASGSRGRRKRELLSVTMRTPGDDFNLVTGFLFAEQIITKPTDIVSIRYSGNHEDESLQENSLVVELSPELKLDFADQKKFITNSACGFCGRAAFDPAAHSGIHLPFAGESKVQAQILFSLPEVLQSSQHLFSETGGAHAVTMHSFDGTLLRISEDAGRHNAMDKIIGAMFKNGEIPLHHRLVLFSGRLSYELVQKSLVAGIPMVCSIGAPTSLAIELASDFGMTVIGFLRNDRMNIYCGEERIQW